MNKLVLPLTAAVVLVWAVSGPAQDLPKEGEIKYSVDYLDKTYGVKFKSAKIEPNPTKVRVRLVLEFSKEIDNLKALKEEFHFTQVGKNPIATTKLAFYCFDEDNVIISRLPCTMIEGELTGKMGDAFRTILDIDPATLKKSKKIEIRPLPKP